MHCWKTKERPIWMSLLQKKYIKLLLFTVQINIDWVLFSLLIKRSWKKQSSEQDHKHAHTSVKMKTVWTCSPSVSMPKLEWQQTVGGHWGQWSEKSFFPAIIKQYNWICSYAGKLVVWISISMLSHKSYFQEQWALSSAKLILHDAWSLAPCFLYTQDILADTNDHVTIIHSSCIYTYISFF